MEKFDAIGELQLLAEANDWICVTGSKDYANAELTAKVLDNKLEEEQRVLWIDETTNPTRGVGGVLESIPYVLSINLLSKLDLGGATISNLDETITQKRDRRIKDIYQELDLIINQFICANELHSNGENLRPVYNIFDTNLDGVSGVYNLVQNRFEDTEAIELTLASGVGGSAISSVGGEGVIEVAKYKNVGMCGNAETGYRFLNWLKDGIVYSTSQVISAQIIKAVEYLSQFIKQWTLTINAAEGGTISPVAGTYTEDAGTIETITATATGDNDTAILRVDDIVVVNPYELTYDADKTVQPLFYKTIQNVFGTAPIKVGDYWVFFDPYGNNATCTNNSGLLFANGDIATSKNTISITEGEDVYIELIIKPSGTIKDYATSLKLENSEFVIFSNRLGDFTLYYKNKVNGDEIHTIAPLSSGTAYLITISIIDTAITVTINGTTYNKTASDTIKAQTQKVILGSAVTAAQYSGGISNVLWENKFELGNCEQYGNIINDLIGNNDFDITDATWASNDDIYKPINYINGCTSINNELFIPYKNNESINHAGILPIIIVGSQSNTVGQFDPALGPSGILAALPSGYEGEQTNIKIMWAGDYTNWNLANSAFENMYVPLNTRDHIYTNPSNTPAFNITGWGLEQKVAHLLQEELQDNVCVIKSALGAQPIQYWSKSAFQPGWVELLTYINAATADALSINKIPFFPAMLWTANESNIIQGTESQYEGLLRQLIADVRSISVYTRNIDFVIAKLSDNNGLNPTAKAVINAAIDVVVSEDSRNKSIDTDGYAMLSDNIHYTPDSLLQISEDFYNSFDYDTKLIETIIEFPANSGIINGIESKYLGIQKTGWPLVEKTFAEIAAEPESDIFVKTGETTNNIPSLIIRE